MAKNSDAVEVVTIFLAMGLIFGMSLICHRIVDKTARSLLTFRGMKRNDQGITYIESILAAAMVGIIALALTSFLRQSQILSMKGTRDQEDLVGAVRLIAALQVDLKSASRHSMGNMQVNGGFENSTNGISPDNWAAGITGNGGLTYEGGANVYRGLKSLGLNSADGSSVSYLSGHAVKVSSAAAYVISGWVKGMGPSMTGKIAGVDINGVEVGSVVISSASWTFAQFRYPSSGFYLPGALNDDKVRIRLSASGAIGQVLFDDVAVKPLYSILISSWSGRPVNVNNQPSNPDDEASSTGFRFVRIQDGQEILFRLRAEANGSDLMLLRERYNAVSGTWVEEGTQNLGRGLSSFSLGLDPDSVLPSGGSNTVQAAFAFKTSKLSDMKPMEVSVYPMAP